MPRLVLFDLDGTLIATRRLYLEAFADALEPVFGRRPGGEEMMALHPRSERRFLRAIGGEEAYEEVMTRFYQAYEARHDQDFEGVYRGVPEMLASLRELPLSLGLVTGKSLRSWAVTAPRIALGSWAVEVFDDEVPEGKPDPAGILLALERSGDPPSEVIYVGDSTTDLEAAERAGVVPAAALWSKRQSEREAFARFALERRGIVFDDPQALASWARGSIRQSTLSIQQRLSRG